MWGLFHIKHLIYIPRNLNDLVRIDALLGLSIKKLKQGYSKLVMRSKLKVFPIHIHFLFNEMGTFVILKNRLHLIVVRCRR